MECLGEPDYDYSFFAGLTGDNFVQHYPTDAIYCNCDATSAYFLEQGDVAFVESVFNKCGFESSYILGRDLRKNKEMYRQALIAYIDKGVPVIVWDQGEPHICGVIVGYEENGNTLLFIQGDNNEPQRISFENALEAEGDGTHGGWIFMGEKKEQRDLKQIYRDAVYALPKLLTTETEYYYAGAEAFRAWANNIENGYFDNVTIDKFDPWGHHTNFVCVLATNSGGCQGFLKKAQELNPDMAFLEEVGKLYSRTGQMWNNDNGTDLEALGGGFNVTLEALQDKEKRGKIVAKIREFAKVTDEIVQVITEGLSKI
jgi:hypothetical protein